MATTCHFRGGEMSWESEAERIGDIDSAYSNWKWDNIEKLIEDYASSHANKEELESKLKWLYFQTYEEDEEFENFISEYWENIEHRY